MKLNEPVITTLLLGIAASVLTSYCTWYCTALGMAAQNTTDKVEMLYKIDRIQRTVAHCEGEMNSALLKLEEKYGVRGDGNMPRTGWYCAMLPPKVGSTNSFDEVWDGKNWVSLDEAHDPLCPSIATHFLYEVEGK